MIGLFIARFSGGPTCHRGMLVFVVLTYIIQFLTPVPCAAIRLQVIPIP